METPIHPGALSGHEVFTAPAGRHGRRWRSILLWVAGLIVVGALIYRLMWGMGGNRKPVVTVPIVAVARVTRQNIANVVPIPAEFRPYVQSELHAMVTGYVSQMNVDFGDTVKKGDVLATLEVPELTDELHNAQGRLEQAQADYTNAHLIYTRLQTVNQQHPSLVAKQDVDTAMSKDASASAAIAAAKADVEKYRTLVNYTKIVAPFDGVITQRSVDPGALVQAGTSSDRSMPLLRISDNYRLRLDFPVSVDYVKDVHVGDNVTVRVDSLGGKIFKGKITRARQEVNEATRTMITEMELQNPDLEIVPGMYAVVLFKYARRSNTLTVPIEAIPDLSQPVAYVVDRQNAVETIPVKVGVETPDRLEITYGLEEGQTVVIGKQRNLHSGEKVQPKWIEPVSPDAKGTSGTPMPNSAQKSGGGKP